MASFRTRHSDSDSNSDSDSDGEKPWKRKCSTKPTEETFVNPLVGQPMKIRSVKFNVWRDVITDQSVTGELGSVDLVKETDTLVSRDVESYRVTPEAVKTLYPDTPDYQDLDNAESDGMDTDENEDDADDFSKMLNSYKKAKVEWDKKPKDLREKILKRKHDKAKKNMEKGNHKGDFVYTSEAKFQSDVPRASAGDAKDIILKCVLDSLQERNKELFSDILDQVGGEKFLEILARVEDVEGAGGMMIKSGVRRRTPGGVFIQLLRSDPIMTPEILKQLFPAEPLDIKQRRKKEARRRKRVKEARLRDSLKANNEEGTMEGTMDNVDDKTEMKTGGSEEEGEIVSD